MSVTDLVSREDLQTMSRKLFGYSLPVTVFPDLILDSDGKIADQITLYLTRPNEGHWVLIYYDPTRRIYQYFDSYGNVPDLIAIMNNLEGKFTLSRGGSILRHLLNEDVHYNEFEFQPLDDKSATCGKWAIIRYLFRDLDEYEFRKLIGNRDSYSADRLINLIWNYLSHL